MKAVRALLVELLRTSRSTNEVRARIARELADFRPTVPFLAWRVSRREVTVRFGRGVIRSVTAECTEFVEYEPEPIAEMTDDAGPTREAVPVIVVSIGRPADPPTPTGRRDATRLPN